MKGNYLVCTRGVRVVRVVRGRVKGGGKVVEEWVWVKRKELEVAS